MVRTQIEIHQALALSAARKKDWPVVKRQYLNIAHLLEVEERVEMEEEWDSLDADS